MDTRFTAIGALQRGSFDASSSSITVHETPDADDEDLFNLAAMQTLMHSGTVYALSPEAMPDGTTIAALYRY